MEIKANQIFYRDMPILLAGTLIFIVSFGYFLGFDINAKSLMYYAISLVSIVLFCLVLYQVIDKFNKRYLIFDEEKIIESYRNEEKTLLFYNQILYTKYHNIDLDWFITCANFNYVEIVYKTDSKDSEAKHICLYLSKKNYRKFFDE